MTAELCSSERLLRRNRQIVIIALSLVAAIAWLYTIFAPGMSSNAFEVPGWGVAVTNEQGMPLPGVGYIFILLAMWWLMMVAMMLPSAAPTILLAAALNRRSTSVYTPYGTALFFTMGYLLIWFIFSLVAVVAQLVLMNTGLLSTMLHSKNSFLTAGLLVAAGVWQFSSIKQACLRRCRSPVEFLTRHRRPGSWGALTMGLHHGAYCLGCCWFLMALLFVGGVMNLYWIAGLAIFVLIEKLYARGSWFGRLAGAGFIFVGALVLVLNF